MCSVGETPSSSTRRRTAARCLFGRPDKEKLDAQLAADIQRLYEQQRSKWGFDFEIGVPDDGKSSEYIYEPIASAEIPSFYHEKMARSRRATTRNGRCEATTSQNQSQCEAEDFKVENEPHGVDKKQHTVVFDLSSPVKKKLRKEEKESVNVDVGIPMEFTTESSESYSKPVTRSSSRLLIRHQIHVDQKQLKQAKLTSYMPVRKRRNEASLHRSASVDSLIKMKEEALKSPTKKSMRIAMAKRTTSHVLGVSTPCSPLPYRIPEEPHGDDVAKGDDGGIATSPRKSNRRLAMVTSTTSAGDY